MNLFRHNINESRYFAKHNLLNHVSKAKPAMTDPQDLAPLRDSKRHRKDRRFRNSSWLRAALVLAAVCALYCYF
jgi:hypothetical protein